MASGSERYRTYGKAGPDLYYSKERKMDPETMARFARMVIAERPGIGTADLGDALGRPLTSQDVEALHRYGRSVGIGQDIDGGWFTVQDGEAVASAYLQCRRTPGADAFFKPKDDATVVRLAEEVVQVAALREAVNRTRYEDAADEGNFEFADCVGCANEMVVQPHTREPMCGRCQAEDEWLRQQEARETEEPDDR